MKVSAVLMASMVMLGGLAGVIMISDQTTSEVSADTPGLLYLDTPHPAEHLYASNYSSSGAFPLLITGVYSTAVVQTNSDKFSTELVSGAMRLKWSGVPTAGIYDVRITGLLTNGSSYTHDLKIVFVSISGSNGMHYAYFGTEDGDGSFTAHGLFYSPTTSMMSAQYTVQSVNVNGTVYSSFTQSTSMDNWRVSSLTFAGTVNAGATFSGSFGTGKLNALYSVGPTPVVEITSMPPLEGILGNTWTYDVLTNSNATVTVAGVTWLSVVGHKIVGTPQVAGTYQVIVRSTIGVHEDVQVFNLTIVNKLIFESSPTGAILIQAVY